MPPKKTAAAPKPPSKEELMFAAIRDGDDATAIQQIEEGANLNKANKDGVNPIWYSVVNERWNVFRALLNKGAKFTCADFDELINKLKDEDPVNSVPIRAVFEKSPGFFLKCNQNRAYNESLWTTVFSGTEDFIKIFIDIVHDKDPFALTRPTGMGMPLVIGLLFGDTAAAQAGVRYLITKAGINVDSDKRKDNPISIVAIESPTDLTVQFVKNCVAAGYDITKFRYRVSASAPTEVSNLLYGILRSDTLRHIVMPYEELTDPIRTDPETDLLSYLIENTLDSEDNSAEYLRLTPPPQIMLRLLMFLKSRGKLDSFMRDTSKYSLVFEVHNSLLRVIKQEGRPGVINIINAMLEIWPEILNAKLSTNDYSIPPYTHLLIYATRVKNVPVVRRLLELGANVALVDSSGKKACDYATDPELKALVCPPEEPSPPFRGLTRSNVQKYNYIFGPKASERKVIPPATLVPIEPVDNNSFCPVCLTDTYRADACNHMQHNCATESPGRYHKGLYDRFKDSKGNIHWCTLCGRICLGEVGGGGYAFIHYNIASAADSVAGAATLYNPSGLSIQGDAYTRDCRNKTDGGGGLEEKFLRIHRLREYAYRIRSANLSEREAYKRLIEQTWNAPFLAPHMNRPELANIKGPESWNIPTAEFRANAEFVAAVDPRPAPPAASYADVKRTACGPQECKPGGCAAQGTLVVTDGMNMTSIDDITETDLGCQFRHREEDADGKPTNVVNEHLDSPFLIRNVVQRIRDYVKNRNASYFGKCIDVTICKARIFPEDLEPLLEHGFPADLYEQYKQLFNWKFGGARLAEGIKPGGEPGPAAALVVAEGGGGGGPPLLPAAPPLRAGNIVVNVNDPRLAAVLANVNNAAIANLHNAIRAGGVMYNGLDNDGNPAFVVNNPVPLPPPRRAANINQNQKVNNNSNNNNNNNGAAHAQVAIPVGRAQAQPVVFNFGPEFQYNPNNNNNAAAGQVQIPAGVPAANINAANAAAIQAALEENLHGGRRMTRRRRLNRRRTRRRRS